MTEGAVAKLRDRFGNRLRYVFRQRPITESDLARRAAMRWRVATRRMHGEIEARGSDP